MERNPWILNLIRFWINILRLYRRVLKYDHHEHPRSNCEPHSPNIVSSAESHKFIPVVKWMSLLWTASTLLLLLPGIVINNTLWKFWETRPGSNTTPFRVCVCCVWSPQSSHTPHRTSHRQTQNRIKEHDVGAQPANQPTKGGWHIPLKL